MDQADDLLKSGAEKRRRDETRRKLLAELNRSTKPNIGMAVISLILFAFLYWSIMDEFTSNDLMRKSDVFHLVVYGSLCCTTLHTVFTSIFKNQRDVFLRDLIEDQIRDEEVQRRTK